MLRSILALLVVSGALLAQDRATLTGTVTDPTGAAVPGASVKATNTATNTASDTKTTTDGIYAIPYLTPGVYNVEVTASGFQTYRRESVTLAVGQRLVLNLPLAVGQATTEITVTGQQEVVESGDASRGLIFDPVKTQEYPLNGRQSYMLLTLTPGVIFGQQQFGASGFSGTRGWDVNSSYKFNGARQGNGNNVFMMNGTPISDNGSQWDFAPSVDSIQEFSAMTTVYDAQYHHEAGGVVNTTIRSGTNNWHGDVYDYFRNRLLDANFFQNNLAGAKKGRHNQNQFGGVFGGPIRKDKDFLFVSFEGWQEVVPFPGSGTTDVPLAMRDGQHFSQYGMTIYDPLTTHACGAPTEPCSGSSGSAYWRTPFPGDVIPQNRISPIATKILSYLPAPNSPGQGVGGIANNYVNANNYGRYWYNQPIIHWDHNFGDRDKFNVLFSEFHGYEFRSSTQYPAPLATGNTDNNRTYTGLSVGETHVINATTVLDIKASYWRFTQLTPGYTAAAQSITAASVGMTNMPHAPTVSSGVIPNINIGGFTGALFGSGSYSWSPYNRWTFTPSVTHVAGKHSLRFGGEVSYEAKGNVAPGNAYGTFYFGPSWTQQATDHASTTNSGADTYLGVADLLLGLPACSGNDARCPGGTTSAGSIDNNTSYYISRPYYAIYAQDDWKVNDRLTVNIGLSYEVQLAYLERYNRMASQFNASAINPLSDQIMQQWQADKAAYDATNPKYPYPNPPSAFYGVWQFAGQGGLPRRSHYTDWTNGAPRLGFAYRLNNKTVIRGGFGVFYQDDLKNNNSQTGFSQTTQYQSSFTVNGVPMPSACYNPISGFGTNNCATAPTGPYSLVNPYPLGLTSAPGVVANANLGQGTNGDWLHYKDPRTYQYSLGVQRQLPWNMLLDVSFAGNYAEFDRDSQDLGNPQDALGLQLQQIAMNDPTFFTRQLANPFVGILPSTTSRGSSTTLSAQTLMNNYPLWGGFSNGDLADRYFRSDAGQMRFEKRAFADANSSLGVITWVFSWTFSKEYAQTCCIGQSWQTTTGANLVLGPGGQTAALQLHPQNPASNRRYDYDSANQPQELALSGVWDMPFGKGRNFGAGVTGLADKLVSGWRAVPIITYISGNAIGLPQAINFCGNYTQYKDPATGQYTGQTAQHWFNNNPACYANFPAQSINNALPQRFSGNVEYPAKPQVGLAIEKYTTFKERYKLQMRAEAFNLTNSAILGSASGPTINTTFSSASFGLLPQSQSNFPRFFQLAAKLYF